MLNNTTPEVRNHRHVLVAFLERCLLELGYKPLQVYSPREVTHYGDE